ncbi:MAG TPA: DUF1992 domain-containing protein [Pedococcus sp.]
MERYESPVERAIREAQERGEFDNLPGAGKPLKGIGGPDDPDWWLKGLMARENLDMTDALPPAIALRKEAATFPESLRDLRSEESVRAVLEDFNRRVRHDRLRPAVGPFPPLLARTVDVDDLVEQWRELGAGTRDGASVTATESGASAVPGSGGGVRRWWTRLRRRG